MKIRATIHVLSALLLVSCVSGEETKPEPASASEDGPAVCKLEGQWKVSIVKVVTDNPPGPCGQQDCGYGAHPNCGTIVLMTAATTIYNDLHWAVPLPGLVGDNWQGTFNGSLQFESTHEFFGPDSNFDGNIDTSTCTLEGTINWAPGTCNAEITVSGVRN